MIKIRYYNNRDVAGIAYGNGFTPEVYLDVDVGKPTYVYSEEGEEEPDGSFRRTFARVEKQYTITTYLQEYMIDAMAALQLHDNIEVWLSNGNVLSVDEFRITDPDWDDLRGLGEITMTFIVYQDSVANGCANVTTDCATLNVPTLVAGMVNNGDLLPCDYIAYVEGDGGEIVSEEDLLTVYEELGYVGTAVQFNVSGTSDDNVLVGIYIYTLDPDGGLGDYELITTMSAAQFASGSEIVSFEDCTTYNEAENYQIKAFAYQRGCEEYGQWSNIVTIANPNVP